MKLIEEYGKENVELGETAFDHSVTNPHGRNHRDDEPIRLARADRSLADSSTRV